MCDSMIFVLSERVVFVLKREDIPWDALTKAGQRMILNF
jgi:hypothetical protein